MKQTICAVRDAKMDMYSRPFFVRTEGEAIRSFTDEVNRVDQNNPYYKHPEDYALYIIGIYDDDLGRIYGHEVPQLVIQADQVKEAWANTLEAVKKGA